MLTFNKHKLNNIYFPRSIKPGRLGYISELKRHMTLEEKKLLYHDTFPLCGLGRRMAQQCILDDYLINSKTPKYYLITVFTSWDTTVEGHYFWKDIRQLYRFGNPDTRQILEVFVRHGIEP